MGSINYMKKIEFYVDSLSQFKIRVLYDIVKYVVLPTLFIYENKLKIIINLKHKDGKHFLLLLYL